MKHQAHKSSVVCFLQDLLRTSNIYDSPKGCGMQGSPCLGQCQE